MWFAVVVYWKTGEIQTIWVRDWGIAWAIANDIVANEDVKKVKVDPEKPK